MASRALIEKIEALPPAKLAKVAELVNSLASADEPLFSVELLDLIKRDHAALARDHGSIDTDEILRDLRETGGR